MVEKVPGKKKILIADISPTVRRLMHGYLKDEFNVVEAETGKEILDLVADLHDCDSHCMGGIKPGDPNALPAQTESCRKKGLDVIIMGYELSDHTASDITKAIRKKYHKLCLPVIISTSTNSRDTIISALDAGANDVIVKPFPKELLLSKMRKLEHAMSVENMQMSEKVANIPFFHGVPVSQVSYLLHTCGEMVAKGIGDVVCKQDDDNHDLFILLDGKCEVMYNGRKVGDIFPIDTVGEMGFVAHGKRSATVMAAIPSQVFVLDQQKFERYLNEERAISEMILRNIILSLNERIKKSNSMINKLKAITDEYLAD
jgi:CheY-like chemotaxis protein